MTKTDQPRRSVWVDRCGIAAMEYALIAGLGGVAFVFAGTKISDGLAAAWAIIMNCFPPG